MTEELKTYGLTCEGCLQRWFVQSRAKHEACRRTPGEKLGTVSIFALYDGHGDRRLQAQPDLEAKFMTPT